MWMDENGCDVLILTGECGGSGIIKSNYFYSRMLRAAITRIFFQLVLLPHVPLSGYAWWHVEKIALLLRVSNWVIMLMPGELRKVLESFR